ncbi:MAG: hypothetical protein IT323_20955 [Anaerolineae bacterium]|nr:hypothetical protein [Anaerolineae bacterium]
MTRRIGPGSEDQTGQADADRRMIEEVEALVGYVFVVGGRAVGATPPGARVELPPRKVQRSREADTFFTLITPAFAASQGNANLYEELSRIAADSYFRSSGGVTSGLRDAVTAVHDNLLSYEQAGPRGGANMICLVLRGGEVYLARTGAVLCLVRQADDVQTLPADLHEVSSPVGRLGSGDAPDVRLSRHEVGPGDVMVLADAGLSHAALDEIAAGLAAPDVPDIIEALKPLCGRDAQAMVVQFVSAETPDPAPPPPRKSTRASTPAASAPVSTPAPSTSASAAAHAGAALDSEPADADAGEIQAGYDEQAGDMPAESDSAGPTPVPHRLAGGLVRVLSGVARGINVGLDRVLPEPEEESGPRVPAMLAAGLAILVPVLVVFVVVALRLSQVDLTAFEQQVAEVEEAAREAETIPLDDIANARTAWLAVVQRVELVETSSGRGNDPALLRVRARAQEVLDRFDQVTRVEPIALRNFGQGARLGNPVIRGQADVYTLNLAESTVFRDTLNPNTVSLMTRNTQPVVQRGQAVGSFSVRELRDMAWMAEGGVQRANVLAALDTQGILVTYSPTFAPATAQRLAGADMWSDPVKMVAWRGRLYLLDPAANQVWRYVPVGNSYPNPPEAYFEPESDRDLSAATDFGIDGAGNLYILNADGSIRKYNGGVEMPFSYTNMPYDGGILSGSGLFLDADSALTAMYVLDPDDESVYQVTLSGQFRFRFRAADPGAWSDLTGIFVDGAQIYVTSGPVLYTFNLDDYSPTPTPTPPG